jgi:hypothetical protein
LIDVKQNQSRMPMTTMAMAAVANQPSQHKEP